MRDRASVQPTKPTAGKKRLAILGSTGSIGVSALEVLDAHPDAFECVALAANQNVDLLEIQARKFRPLVAAMADPAAADALAQRLRGEGIEVLKGDEGVIQAATLPGLDLMLSGIVGGAGLLPTLAALRAGIDIAFVNKEVLVLGGELVTSAARESGARILPVDSEISAIFQCLEGCRRREDVRRVFLTASGGPFRTRPLERFRDVTPEQALRHPNWRMGAKVTVDSATLMNKGFEVIEAKWLFGLDLDRIHVVVHPQSVIHSYVEYVDGSIVAQLGVPDMKVPIQYALTYPHRLPTPTSPLDLTLIGALTFEMPDTERFPCLALAYEAASVGGTMPAVLSGADEIAVEAFLQRRIRFDEIPELLRDVMSRHTSTAHLTLEQALAAEGWAKDTARQWVALRAVGQDLRVELRSGNDHV